MPVVAAFYSDEPLGVLDAIAAVLYLGLVAFEATADRQMYGLLPSFACNDRRAHTSMERITMTPLEKPRRS